MEAIKKDGSLVAPGSADTLKFDYTVDPGTASANKGLAKLVTTLSHKQTSESPYSAGAFEDLTADSGITVPEILKSLAIMPHGEKDNHGDHLWMRNIGERLPFRGGSFLNTSRAGVFALFMSITHVPIRIIILVFAPLCSIKGIRLMVLPFRGGRWMYGSEAGVFACNLQNPRSNSSDAIGFRSALFHKGLDYVCCLFVVVLLRRIALQRVRSELNEPRSYSNSNYGFRSALTPIRATRIGLYVCLFVVVIGTISRVQACSL